MSYTTVLTAVSTWLAAHSVRLLRVALGLIFAGFGVLKFFPGASPAEALVKQTIDALTFGLVPPDVAIIATAVMEVFIGLTLITGIWLRVGLLVMAGALVGIMSPLVLFFDELFGSGVTLTAQYVLKDVVLVAAGLVVAAVALGARLVPATADETADEAAVSRSEFARRA